MYKNATILVTGGTGSWGVELIRQLLKFYPNKIIVYSRNENHQVELRRKFEEECVVFYIGDIRDKEALVDASKGVDLIFHLAALKHVPVCEENPLESIKTNVLGTQNVIEAALENKVKKVIYVSTDKAADPVNTYGMTKALGERLVLHANTKTNGTKFVCVRAGNVLGSSGSVLPLFKKQISELGEIQLTDKRMVRYFVTPKDAISKLLKAACISQGGDTFIMRMKSIQIEDLAEVLIELSGKNLIKLIEIGPRTGEKLKEILVAENEKEKTSILDDDFYIIAPYLDNNNQSAISFEEEVLTKEQIKEMLLIEDLV